VLFNNERQQKNYPLTYLMSQPKLFVIVLSNNLQEDTYACLNSLLQSDYVNFKIILLENAPTNSDIGALRAQFPDVQIIQLTENLGYAGNNNIGIDVALEQGAEWILILNNDTILDKACLSRLVEAGEDCESIGIVGPMVYHYDEPDIIQSAGGMLGPNWQFIHLGMNEKDQGQYSTIRKVDWISGCAIMVRRTLIEQVGALDPSYFLYWEETEWCIRANEANWMVVQVPSARLWHKGVKRNYEPKPYVTYYMTRNYLFTLAKHKAPYRIRIFALGMIIGTLFSWSFKPRWRNKRGHRNAMWRGLLDYFHNRLGQMPS
jgi:GT2 family glycosyltransferase